MQGTLIVPILPALRRALRRLAAAARVARYALALGGWRDEA